MTGEVTLRGRVLEIGGLREKSMAAYRAGVKKVLIPKDNVADLAEIDDIVKENVTFIPCDHVRQVLAEALVFDNVSANDKSKQNPQDNLLLPPVNGKILSGNSLNC